MTESFALQAVDFPAACAALQHGWDTAVRKRQCVDTAYDCGGFEALSWEWVPASPSRARLGGGWLRLVVPCSLDGCADTQLGSNAPRDVEPSASAAPPIPSSPVAAARNDARTCVAASADPCEVPLSTSRDGDAAPSSRFVLTLAVVHSDVYLTPQLLLSCCTADGAPAAPPSVVAAHPRLLRALTAEIAAAEAPLCLSAGSSAPPPLCCAEHPHDPGGAWWGAHGCGVRDALALLLRDGDAANARRMTDIRPSVGQLMAAWWPLVSGGVLGPALRVLLDMG